MQHVAARNLEIKVACGADGLADIRARLEAEGVAVAERLRQIDTYFAVPNGRLKLREIADLDEVDGAEAKLIGYVRPDTESSRWSTYHVATIAPSEAPALLASLDVTIGTRVRVAKRRDIALWDATRVHLDEVERLGAFVELETVIAEQSEDDAMREHERIVLALGLDRWAPISGSYSDLLLNLGNDEPA